MCIRDSPFPLRCNANDVLTFKVAAQFRGDVGFHRFHDALTNDWGHHREVDDVYAVFGCQGYVLNECAADQNFCDSYADFWFVT